MEFLGLRLPKKNGVGVGGTQKWAKVGIGPTQRGGRRWREGREKKRGESCLLRPKSIRGLSPAKVQRGCFRKRPAVVGGRGEDAGFVLQIRTGVSVLCECVLLSGAQEGRAERRPTPLKKKKDGGGGFFSGWLRLWSGTGGSISA